MSKRLDCSVEGLAATIEVRTSAEISAGGTGRQRVSGTVESIRPRGCTVRSAVEVSGEPFVEQTVGVDEGQALELAPDQDDLLAFDSSGNTVGYRW